MRRAEMGRAGVAHPGRWNVCDWGESSFFFFFDLADSV